MAKYTSVFLQTSSVLQVLGLWLVSSIVLALVELSSTADSHTSRPSRSRTKFLLPFFFLLCSVVVVAGHLCRLFHTHTAWARVSVCSFGDRSVRRSVGCWFCLLDVRLVTLGACNVSADCKCSATSHKLHNQPLATLRACADVDCKGFFCEGSKCEHKSTIWHYESWLMVSSDVQADSCAK